MGAGELAGSRGYMPPEQRQGRLLDGRADLWSLGAVLVALLTGRPPSWKRPARSVDRLTGVPEGLVALLHDLLRDDPLARPGFAGDVAVRLAEVGAARVVVDARPTLHRPRCLGRQDVTAALLDVGRRGGVGAVVGPTGRGKTRVLLEVARCATACWTAWTRRVVRASTGSPPRC